MLRKKYRTLFYLTIALLLTSFSVYAQNTSVSATINPSKIKIGEQSTITLDVKTAKDRQIYFPKFAPKDTLVAGVEILEVLRPDTIIDANGMSIKHSYVVTSFDSASYVIPPFAVIDLMSKDTIRSKELNFTSVYPQLTKETNSYLDLMKSQKADSINFHALQLRDIKPILIPALVWTDYLIYLWIGLAILAIALCIYFLTRKKKKGYYFKPVVILPPHVLALQVLDKVKAEKIWQQGREKEFYTIVTDTLRTYIEKRFGLNALEKTSDEILESMPVLENAESVNENLFQVLKLADLVKFAKYIPSEDEDNLSLMNAYLFVNQTKKETPIVTENERIEGEEDPEKMDTTTSNPEDTTVPPIEKDTNRDKIIE